MDLRDYIRVLRKSWALILAVVVVGIGVGLALTLATQKVYQATAQVFVASSVDIADSATINSGNTFATSRVQSYIAIANSPKVTTPVISSLGLTMTDQQLAAKITADAPLNKVLINLHVTDHNPAQAATLARAVTAQFIEAVQATDVDAKGSPLVTLTEIRPATVPGTPIKPNKIVNIGLGLILGLLGGIAFALGREVLDNTVKNTKDFEQMGVALLGTVPFDKRTARLPIAFRGDPHSARSEAYRQLRTNLQFVDVDNPPRIIAVTSAIPGEGKSTTAINLAAALAEAGSRVCLIEADLRRPSIAKSLGLVGDVGFTTVVIGKTPVESVLQNAGHNLAVLTSGPIPPNPSELLISQHAKQVILDVAAKVDYTIIDTPPLLPVTDGAEISTLADATVLVHRAGKTTKDQAIRSIAALEKVGRRPVGVILNMITRGGGGKYDYEYGYYYYAYRPNGSGDGRERSTRSERRSAAAETASAGTAATLLDDATSTDEIVVGASSPRAARKRSRRASREDAREDRKESRRPRRARHGSPDEELAVGAGGVLDDDAIWSLPLSGHSAEAPAVGRKLDVEGELGEADMGESLVEPGDASGDLAPTSEQTLADEASIDPAATTDELATDELATDEPGESATVAVNGSVPNGHPEHATAQFGPFPGDTDEAPAEILDALGGDPLDYRGGFQFDPEFDDEYPPYAFDEDDDYVLLPPAIVDESDDDIPVLVDGQDELPLQDSDDEYDEYRVHADDQRR